MSLAMHRVRDARVIPLQFQIALRRDLKPERTSSANSFGYSQAAKCPPLSSLLKWIRLGYAWSAQLRGAW
jgi:hypothetical protein